EIDRCAPSRMVVLTRVGNAAVMPNEGSEGTLADYLEEFGNVTVRSFDEAQLVGRYLQRVSALALPIKSHADLDASKWLSFAWNVPDAAQCILVSDAIAPHAVGQVGVNPIYSQAPRPGGSLQLR